MSNTSPPSGPGPLIWVVVGFGVVAGLIWNAGVGIAVAVATTAIFWGIGNALMKSEERRRQRRRQELNDEYRRKYGTDLPAMTPELRGFFDRMTGRGGKS